MTNVTMTQAVNTKFCPTIFSNQCPDWMPVGIKEQVKAPIGKMMVYPNPSNGLFNLSYKDAKEIYTLTVYDAIGRIVTTKKVDLSNNKTATFEIKTKGFYVVSVSNEFENLTHKVIVE